MKAVIWTDVFQSVVMIAGILAILIKGFVIIGGIGDVMDLAEEGNRLIWLE